MTIRLSKSLNTEVSVKRVSFSFLNRMDLERLMVRDHKKDTLLYAGMMKVRITDWFIFRDKADLKYIGLENAVIKTNRTDSVWNYQFLVDYFAASNSPKSNPAKKRKSIEFDLKKLDLRNVSFTQKDDWRGETMIIRAGTVLMDGNDMDFEKGELDVAELTMNKPFFALYNYPGNRKKRPKSGAFHLNPGGLVLKIARLELNNGTFVNERQTDRAPYSHFDGNHMVISKINGEIENFSFIGDTIRGKLALSAKERSGFELRKMKADFRFDTREMEFANLDLQTPRSRVRDYYRMAYDDFEEDMSSFVNEVTLSARFRQAEIHSDDIAYFAPDVKNWNRRITASGVFNGMVSNLRGDNVFVRAGNSTVSGDVVLLGLPNTEITSFSLNGNVSTNYNDLTFYAPEIREVTTPDLKSLGDIRFSGNFNGTVRKFTARGNLSTNIGNAYTDVSMSFPDKGQPSYVGAVNTRRFNLGRFLNIPRLGNVSMNGKINGVGFNKNTLRTSFDGTIHELQYGTITYLNIATNGTFQKGAFAGEVRMNDPNLNFTSNISIDFNGAQPRFIVLGDVANADLQALKLTKDRFILAGLFDLDFTGTNIDNFLGSAKLINASLTHNNTRLSFDSLSIQTDVLGGEKLLSVKSNEIDAVVRGNYNILDLHYSFQSYLHNYFPSYINAPPRIPQDQRFTVDITTRNIGDFVSILDRRLQGFDNSAISGSINTTRPDSGFVLTTVVPYFRFDKTSFSGVNFSGIGNAKALKLNGTLDLITVGDSLYFPNTRINIESANDFSSVSIRTKANNTLNEADLNATVQTLEDGVQINFRPSSFVINDQKWTLEKEGELVLRKHYIAARDIKFTQGFQEVTVSTRTPDGGNVDELVVNLKDIHLGDFIHFVTKEPRMQGLVSGEVVITDIFDQLTANAQLRASEFRLDNDSIGLVNILADYVRRTGKVNFRISSNNEPYNLAIEGLYNIKDSTGSPLATVLRLNSTRISFINRFLSSVFSDIDGFATGDLQVLGNINRPHLLGRIKLRNAGMKVNFTQVYYRVDEADLNFAEDRIDFGQFTLRDQMGNTGTARGVLYQRAFNNMRFDFELATPRMLLLDTKPTDNESFYGRAVGRATLSIRGPADNMQMNITGEMNDTSHIFVPTSDSRESADADFIVFRQPGREVKPAPATTNITVDLDVSATSKAAIDVILDPIAGDVLKARGNGRLRIHAGTSSPVTMNGRYTIEQGNYDFNFQSLIRKPFTIDPSANNYIQWTGDPYEAEIHVDALYTAESVSLNELVANNKTLNLGSGAQAYRGDVYVIAEMRDKLTQPKINFRLDFPSSTGLKNDYEFSQFLAKLQNDQNEMNKQVTYLLFFGSFAPYGEGRNVTQNLYNFAYKGLSDIFNRQMNNIVNDLLYRITGDRSIKLDVSTSFYSSASLLGNTPVGGIASLGRLDRSAVDFRLAKSFLNGNIILNVGGNVDFGLGNNSAFQSGNFQWLPDWNIEFILNRSRKLRMIVFQRNSLDINTTTASSSLGKRNRYGISLSYSNDFD